MPSIISIEGNIGAGKSTLLNRIQARINQTPNMKRQIHIIPEEIDVWNKFRENDKGLLELFYENKSKYCYPFQILTFLTLTFDLMGAYKSVGYNDIIICERSPVGNVNVFGELLYKNGFISEIQMNILRYLANGLMVPVDNIVYLKTSVNECLRRVEDRDRTGEDMITIDYLKEVENRYNEFMETVPHHKIETDEDIDAFIEMMFTDKEISIDI
jgi:deoxyadenosine/deoxycytidine kinase